MKGYTAIVILAQCAGALKTEMTTRFGPQNCATPLRKRAATHKGKIGQLGALIGQSKGNQRAL